MKAIAWMIPAVATLAIAGCQTGPRPYDGVVGYTLKNTEASCSVEYVEEVHASYTHLVRHARKLCANKRQVPADTLATTVTVDQAFQQEVPVSIVIPGPAMATGDMRSGSQGDAAISIPTQNRERVMRTMTLQRIRVECVPQAPAAP